MQRTASLPTKLERGISNTLDNRRNCRHNHMLDAVTFRLLMDDWKLIDHQVQTAFEDSSVLHVDRATLDRWLITLTGRTHTYERDQAPMLRRLEVLRHLTSVRLAEESQLRRDTQQAAASEAMQRHNFWTRWISIGALIVAALAVWVNWWTHATREAPSLASPPAQSQAFPTQTPPAKSPH